MTDVLLPGLVILWSLFIGYTIGHARGFRRGYRRGVKTNWPGIRRT